jgi:hypothetical protein
MTSNIIALFLVFIFADGSQTPPSKKTSAFDARMYPASEYQVSEKNYVHGRINVRIIQAKSKEHINEPHYCRAWFEVRNGNSLVKHLYYHDIEPVGFSYGIFVPNEQPLPDYFVAVKEGDYDGRLLMVAKDGQLTDLPSGFYFVTSDKRFLVGDYASDDNALIVVDIAKRQIVIDGRKDRKIPEDFRWYRDRAGYFFTVPDESNKKWPPREKTGRVYRLDLVHPAVVGTPMTASQLATAHKVSYDFDPRQKSDCISTPQ